MRSILFTSLLQLLAVATSQSTPPQNIPVTIDVIPAIVADGPSTVQFVSTGSNFDAPKVRPLNGSTFDWWYFDVVSDDLDYSLVVVFFASTPNGLWPGVASNMGSAVYASAVVTLPDGSSLGGGALGEDLTVVTVGDGSSGALNGTGWGWVGLPDMSRYEIIIDDAEGGVQGTVSFQAVRIDTSNLMKCFSQCIIM